MSYKIWIILILNCNLTDEKNNNLQQYIMYNMDKPATYFTYSTYYIFFIIVIMACFFYFREKYNFQMEKFDNKNKWVSNPTCTFRPTQIIREVLKEHKISRTKQNDWILYFPCSYNNISKEIRDREKYPQMNANQKYFIIQNANEIASKDKIWKNFVDSYGRIFASSLMPETFILNNNSDVKLLKKEHSDGDIYILKKNIQRQEGLYITKNIQKILKEIKNGYVIAQRLLQDPYLINGRKINMRFYIVVSCQNKVLEAHVYNDGFMYYTKDKFRKNSTDFGPNVTTGYIDRRIYKTHPLTHADFRDYLDKERKLTQYEIDAKFINMAKALSDIVFDRIYGLLKKTIVAIEPKLCNQSVSSFQLFGADIAIDEQLVPQLMEINKGPDLGGKGGRDKQVKKNMVTDMFRLMGIIKTRNGKSNNYNFIKLI